VASGREPGERARHDRGPGVRGVAATGYARPPHARRRRRARARCGRPGADRLPAAVRRGPRGDREADVVARAHLAARAFEKTYEERLARTLRKLGPFVAVGDPTERLPLLGAARMYAADEDWRETVDELTARAGVVLLQAGEGDGLAWEVRHVIELDAPERAILSLPLHAKRTEPSRQERYDAFRRRFGDDFPRPLPEAIGHCQFAYFDADWTPRLLGESGAPLPAGDSERAKALRRLAREFKIAWSPLWARIVVYCAASLAALAGLEALISSAS
jgi:hypothetical protein